jgi:rfaE bifunctional protein kinase chain/domain
VTNSEINKLFNSFNGLNVLIIGDVMIDSYYWGEVSRISPEAPVPIVAVRKKENRLGGAGNVVINIQALGANPYLCGVAGKDDNSEKLMQILKEKKLPTEGIIRVDKRPTTTKTRIISNHHHLIRIDEEDDGAISKADSDKLFKSIEKFIKSGKMDVIIFEDYDKGVISAELIDRVTALAKKHNLPTVVDPKKRNFNAYKNVTLFKPNLKELREGMGADVAPTDINQLNKATEKLRKEQNIDIALITLSEYGVYVNAGRDKGVIPAHIRNIADVSGAGDSVVSVAALCCALKASPITTAFLSNLAGGQVCEKSGVVPINKKQLLEEALDHVNEEL